MVYSRVENLTHHTRQMKLSNAIAEAAIVLTSQLRFCRARSSRKRHKKTFDSYCGTKANDRKVEFTGETLTIDSVDGIDKGQIVKCQFSQNFSRDNGLFTVIPTQEEALPRSFIIRMASREAVQLFSPIGGILKSIREH